LDQINPVNPALNPVNPVKKLPRQLHGSANGQRGYGREKSVSELINKLIVQVREKQAKSKRAETSNQIEQN